MKPQLADTPAAIYVITKLLKEQEAVLSEIKESFFDNMETFASLPSDDLLRLPPYEIRGMKEGIYRLMFGGSSAIAYYDGLGSVALFGGNSSYEVEKKASLKNKEELCEALGLKKTADTETIEKTIRKNYPDFADAIGIDIKSGIEISVTRKKTAPTKEEAYASVSFWAIKKKLDDAIAFFDGFEKGGLSSYGDLSRYCKKLEEFKDYLKKSIENHSESFDGNPFVSIAERKSIVYNNEALDDYLKQNKGGADLANESRVSEQKKGLYIKWAGSLDDITDGILDQSLMGILDRQKSAFRGKEESGLFVDSKTSRLMTYSRLNM